MDAKNEGCVNATSLWEVLKEEKVEGDEKAETKKSDLQDKAYSTLILSLSDRVLREVSKEETAAEVWAKLKSLYICEVLSLSHLK